MLQSRVRRNGFEGAPVGPITYNECIFRIHPASTHGQFSVGAVGRHHCIAEAKAQLFKPDLGLVEDSVLAIFRKIELRAHIVMVEDVLDPNKFEGQGDQENIVWRIAALDYMESASQIDPPRI